MASEALGSPLSLDILEQSLDLASRYYPELLD